MLRRLTTLAVYWAVFCVPSYYLVGGSKAVALGFCLGFFAGLLNEIKHNQE